MVWLREGWLHESTGSDVKGWLKGRVDGYVGSGCIDGTTILLAKLMPSLGKPTAPFAAQGGANCIACAAHCNGANPSHILIAFINFL